MMGLLEVTADKLKSESFYLVEQANDSDSASNNPLKPLSLKETIAYILKTRSLPINPGLTFVGSGGSAKGYYVVGFVKKLREVGIKIDHYRLSSVSSLLAILELTNNFKTFEEFTLEVPELIEPIENPKSIRVLEKLIPEKFHAKLHTLGTLINLVTGKELETEEGKFTVNRGLFSTKKLEDRLRYFCGDKKVGEMKQLLIMATDYKERKTVVLGRDFPDMPLYKAILASLAIPQYFEPIEYNGRLFVDAGVFYHFPLIPELLDGNKTVIAIRLGHPHDKSDMPNLGGLKGYFKNITVQEEIRILETTQRLVKEVTGTTTEELAKKGDTKKLRVYLDLPDLSDIPPVSIHIPYEKRLELIGRGYKGAEKAIERFSKPPYFFRDNPNLHLGLFP